MNKRDKIITEARERYQHAKEAWGPIYAQAREDINFSDPTNPQQWDEQAKRERQNSEGGPRPCLVFDQTNQFIRQVVNTARRNKPAMKFLPVDDQSDPELAEVLQGLARQTEYESRALTAYITSLDHAARGGIGYFGAVTEEDKGSDIKGQLWVKIRRFVDFSTVLPDPEFQEPDGSDMMYCFVEDTIPRKRFEKDYPGAAAVDWDSDGWFGKDQVRICEYWTVEESTANILSVNGQEMSEDDYWEKAKAGEVDPATRPEASLKKTRVVRWRKITGESVLEETTFPAEFIPIFPVIGNETWEKGKRRLSGAVRLARDGQISYNFERNSEFEAVAVGPKAPYLAPIEAIEGHESKWRMANRGNLAYLPYNSLDESGNQVQPPSRIQPAGIAAGWTALSERSKLDIQSALGMYQASVGNNPNDQSGRAVLALQNQADVGSYHYIDNLAEAIAHCGRVLTQVWPSIYDQKQIVRILGEDEEPEFVEIDPQAPRGYQKAQALQGEKTIINLSAGRFDVRCIVGPAYLTKQMEAAAEIGEMVNGNPQMMALLGDLWIKMKGYPEADKIAKRLNAMLPPQVRQAESEEGQPDPQQMLMAMQQLQQQNQQLQQALQEAQSGMAAEQMRAQTTLAKAQLDNDAKRDIEELRGVVQLLIQQMQPPPQLMAEVQSDFGQS